MKYIIALADGCADLPAVCGMTPLGYANTPCLARLSARAVVGRTCLIPPGCIPGSQSALLTLLGAPRSACSSGRAAIEAMACGIDLDGCTALRCNFVSLDGDRLVAHDGGGLTDEETTQLIDALEDALGDDAHRFVPGSGYRAFLLRRGLEHPGGCSPDGLLGYDLRTCQPEDDDLERLYHAAREVLDAHPVNLERKAQGKLPANAVWFWGGGPTPVLPDFTTCTGLRGAATGGVPLVRGIASGMGLEWLNVPHADGTLHTNWEGKAFAAFDALTRQGMDFVFVHAEAPDEAGHAGSLPEKVASIEYFDRRLLTPLTGWLDESAVDYRLLVLPDHPTPISLRTHTADPVPFLLYDSRTPAAGGIFDEIHTGNLPLTPGEEMLDVLLERKRNP